MQRKQEKKQKQREGGTFLWISSNISGVGSSFRSFSPSLVSDASSTCTLGDAC